MPRGSPRIRTEKGQVNAVGERVRQRRRELKLGQDALCGRLAEASEGRWVPDRREIYKMESGTRSVRDLEVLALARALLVSPCWLLTGEETAGSNSASDA